MDPLPAIRSHLQLALDRGDTQVHWILHAPKREALALPNKLLDLGERVSWVEAKMWVARLSNGNPVPDVMTVYLAATISPRESEIDA